MELQSRRVAQCPWKASEDKTVIRWVFWVQSHLYVRGEVHSLDCPAVNNCVIAGRPGGAWIGLP